MIREFVLALADSESVSVTMETKAREIANLIDDPNYVRCNRSLVNINVTVNRIFFRSTFASQGAVPHYDVNPLNDPMG